MCVDVGCVVSASKGRSNLIVTLDLQQAKENTDSRGCVSIRNNLRLEVCNNTGLCCD